MGPPPKRQRLDPPPQNVSSQETLTNASHNDLTNTHNGTGVSNAGGNFHVGGNVNINSCSHASPHPTAANDARKDLLESLQFDQIDARHDSIKKAHAKTCRWFLDTDVYKTWEETGSSHANNFLWIKGKPGAGKSTLMKFLHGQIRARIDPKKSTGILISFFFNARGHELEKSTLGLYRSLLWQLLHKRPDLQQVLDELRPAYHWTSESLKSRLYEAIQKLGETPIFFLIDALDECDQDQIRDMIPFLETLVDAKSSVHICFASRHYPHVTVQTSLDIILEERDGHEQDIATYLGSALRIKPKDLAEQIRTELQEKAHGVFIWVVLVVDILNKEYDAGRNYRLRERLQELPGDLHLLFRDILTRDTNNRAGLLLCIQWVLFAKEPLTPRQLHLAILSGTEPQFLPYCHSEPYLEDDLQRYILDNSKGLAQPTKSKIPTVQFIHESVRDFLLKGNGLGELFNGPEPNIHGESHEALKNCCLTYLDMESLVELDKYTRNDATQAFPFLEYAHSGILYHADKAGQSGIGQEQFLSIFPRSQWVKHHNFMEKAGVRRYTSNVSLFYILAEAGLSELIRAHSCRQSCFEIEGERYGVPILAARALKHEKAAQVMLELQAERKPGFDFADFCKRFQSAETSTSRRLGRSYQFPKSRKLLEELIEHTDDQMSLLCLETTFECSKYNTRALTELFFKACERGRPESAKFLVQHCANMANGDGGNTPLHQASENGILEKTNFLVNRGAGLLGTDKHGNTPLHTAVRHDHYEVAQLLLQHDADISAAANDGSTPLHTNGYQGSLQMFQLLIHYGADISATDKYGHTPLRNAARNGHFDVSQRLIALGADTSSLDKEAETPLHQAALNGHFDVAQLLIESGADKSAVDKRGATPLHQAARNGHFDVVQRLLDSGADISAVNEEGKTPLHQAARTKNFRVAELLIDSGANKLAVDKGGETPLHQAASTKNFRVAQLLIMNGAHTSAVDKRGATPLHLAVSIGGGYVVDHDADPDILAACNNANIPLDDVLRNGQYKVAKLLVGRGANLSAVDEQGLTPLHRACQDAHIEIVRLLIKHGADSSATTSNGATPLHQLVSNANHRRSREQDLEIAKVLVDSGADILAPDYNGRTPLQMALDRGLTDMAEMFQSCGSESSTSDHQH